MNFNSERNSCYRDNSEVNSRRGEGAAAGLAGTGDTLKVELKLVTSKEIVSDFQGGNDTVTVPVDSELAKKEVVCVYIDDNGKYTMMEGSLSSDGKSYTLTTGYFSTYAILEKAEADAEIIKQTDKVGTANVKVIDS